MAGIIVDVSDDIKKLQSLKKEIEGVKNQLKGINIKVDLDIKEGLESKLKALTDQYANAASQIAETEGRIMASLNRINSATERITGIQERVSSNVGAQGSNTSGASANQAETESVKAQAKAYDELKQAIEDATGSLGQNIVLMIREQEKIKSKKEQIKELEKELGNLKKSQDSPSKDLKIDATVDKIAKLTEEVERSKIVISSYKQSINNDLKIGNAASTSMNALSQELGKMRSAYRDLTEEERNSPFGQQLLASIQQADAKIKELDASIGNHQRNVGNYASAFGSVGEKMNDFLSKASEIPGPLGNVASSIQGMTKAAMTFIATPLGMVLAAIAAALATVTSWFKRTEEGENALNVMTSYFSATLNSVLDVADNVGEWLFNAFTKPKKALNDLVGFMKEQVMNRLYAIGDAGKAIYKIFSGDVSEGFKELGNASLQFSTGIEDAGKKLDSFVEDASKKAKQRAEIARKQNSLDAKEREFLVEKAKIESKISSLRANAYDERKSEAERSKLLKEASMLTDEMYKKEISLAKERYEIQRDTNTLSHSNKEDKKAEAQLEAKLYQIETQRENAQRMLLRQSNKFVNNDKKQKEQQQKLSDELLALRRKNQKDEISLMEEGTEKKLAQINADYETQKQEIEKNARELAKANKKAGITDVNANGLTGEQQDAINEANRINGENQKKQIQDIHRSEVEAMRGYLKEYGTFQQQKLAIAEEYAEKIKKAQNEGERLSLEKQRDSTLLAVDVKAAQQNIDWQSVFGDLGDMLKEQVQPTIDNLKKIAQSAEFKNASVDDQQKIYDIISRLEQQSGSLGKDMFKDVARDLELYRNSLNAYNKAQNREIEAANKLAKAQEKLRIAQENGGDLEAAKQAVNEAQEKFSLASESVKALGEKASENAEVLKTSSEKAKGALEGLAGSLNKLKSGSLTQAFEGIKDVGNVIGGKLGDAIANIDPTGIIGGVLSILDILKDGFSSIFVSLQDTLYGAIEGILNDVFSGDIIVKPIKNALDHVGNILNTVTFGGFNSWISSSNAKEVAETTERLTNSNDRLRDAVDNLKDEMSKTGGWKAIDTAQQAKKDQETINKQTLEILMAQMGYHGSHHSNAYYWGLGRADYASLNSTLRDYAKKNNKQASSVGSLEDIYKLTPEQMDYIRTYNIEMWEKMLSQGEYDKSEYWENYADLAGELEEITESLKETLTQTSFDSLRDSFIDSLMDMDKSAEDFADDFQDYLMKSILNAKISDLLDKDLHEFYDKWADYAESDNELSEAERKELEARWDELTRRGLEIRDQVASFTGYGSGNAYSQEASGKGFEAMNQDVGMELNGRFTALQISGEEIKKLTQVTNDWLAQIYALMAYGENAMPDVSSEKTAIEKEHTNTTNVVLQDGKINELVAEVVSMKGILDEVRTINANGSLERASIAEGMAILSKNSPKILAAANDIKRNTD